MTNSVESRWVKLTEREKVLKRPARYIGSVLQDTFGVYVIESGKLVLQDLTFTPAFIKLFDEILTNSSDHSRTPDGAHMKEIRVSVDKVTGEISVYDDGGIPVVIHKVENCYLPHMLFYELHSGDSFNDEAEYKNRGTGQNGEGASLVTLLSKKFTVDTCDGKKRYQRTYTDNSTAMSDEVVTDDSNNGTTITYLADFDRLNMKGIDDNTFKILERRVYDIAACCPNLNVYFNDELINLNSFEDYVKMLGKQYSYSESDDWKIAILKTDIDDFDFSLTLTNCTNNFKGGTNVEYVISKIIGSVRNHILEETGQDFKPAVIKQHLQLMMESNVDKPRYNSQTKEELINAPITYGTTWNPSDEFIDNILKSEAVETLIELARAKQFAEEEREAKALEKQLKKDDPRRIEGFSDANSRKREDCTLFLTEGKSAAKPMAAAADRNLQGFYPLRGRVINVRKNSKRKVMANKEFQQICVISGASVRADIEPTFENGLRFGRFVFATDADQFGASISGLLVNLFHKFWPKLLEDGRLYILRTPIYIARKGTGKSEKLEEFFTDDEFKAWDANRPSGSWKVSRLKGLGGNQTEDFKRYLSDEKYLIQLTVEDVEDYFALDVAFNGGKDKNGMNYSDLRKVWLVDSGNNSNDIDDEEDDV